MAKARKIVKVCEWGKNFIEIWHPGSEQLIESPIIPLLGEVA
jgi:hypothetical protein